MAGGSAEVMQEYLVKLGFQTDQISLKKFEGSLGAAGSKVMNVGLAVAGVVASVEAATAAFAYSMRKTYFAAELANSSVKSMQAMSYAGKQFGISGDSMASSIKGMAQAMRLNPGLQGLVESFGIKVSGRDTSDVMMDFVKTLKDMPEFTGQKYAEMFGMDADTFHQLRSHYDEIIAKRDELNRMQKESGVDMDKQKESILQYTTALDKLSARFSIFSSAFLSAMSPVFTKTANWLDDFLKNMTSRVSKFSENMAIDTARVEAGLPTRASTPSWMSSAPSVSVPASGTSLSTDKQQQHLATLEKKYNLPSGLLWNQYGQESGFGKNNFNAKSGAEGPFQFMPKTSEEYGLKNPYDFNESSDAAARKMRDLHKQYKGDTAQALAAYNFGQGNLARTGMEGAPRETQDYVKDIMGGTARLGTSAVGGITQHNTTTIHVTGNGAEATAKAVAGQQSRVLGNAVRMAKVAIG